ncbi:MAG: DNA-directed RNA polymerase subunit beta', partial [Planctomycetaceae bacterium]|nr:DNA-directed RNA polymerase subunit beta' [Planctomycetaceae bacterium]
TDEVIVREDELITVEIARRIEKMGLEKIQVRSPMTCESKLGLCRLCYGMDLSTGSMVEEGLAAGIVAAQSIGEPGTQLTMRTFHIGGTASREVEDNEIRTRRAGKVRFARIRSVENTEGRNIVLTRNGEVIIIDPKERELERYTIPNGATLMVREDQDVENGAVLCTWDPHSVPILAEVGGRIRFEDCIEGKTVRTEREASGTQRRTVIEHRGDLQPLIALEDETGRTLAYAHLPERASIDVQEGQQVSAGTALARTPREALGTQDITGGLPRVTELFEARKPKDPAVVAEVDGVVELPAEKKRGKRVILIRASDNTEVEHIIPQGKQLLVHTGDEVRAGDALVRGPLVPHDILRVSGEEAVQQYLLHEIQNVYRSQRVEIDDKHIEIVIAQMLRKKRIDDVGDTDMLPGLVVDKFRFNEINEALHSCVRIVDPGDTEFRENETVPTETVDEVNAEVEAAGQQPATYDEPRAAIGVTQLLGITKAAVASESFISAASFQETTKVLTEAALAGKVDGLVGLKENVILGHLIPAGTGFHIHQDAEVRIRREALEELQAEKERILAARLNLLAEGGDSGAPAEQPSAASAPSIAPSAPPEPGNVSQPSILDVQPDAPPEG